MKDFNSAFHHKKPATAHKLLPKTSISKIFRSIIIFAVFGLVAWFSINIPAYLNHPLKSVTIHGNETIDKATIATYLNISADQNWLDVDPFELSLRLKRLAWIETVVVRRNLWHGIDVYVTEKKPVAFLRTQNQTWLICKDATVFGLTPQKKAWDLPVIVNDRLTNLKDGSHVNQQYLIDAFSIINLLKNNSVIPLKSISEIIITDPINIRLISIPHGIEIRMGHEKFGLKLKRLAKALPTLDEYIHNIDYIDLRHSDGVVFKKIK